MGNKTYKAALCLLIIAVVFVGIGCAGRNAGKNDQGSTVTATPTPAPTVQPGNTGNYTTNLSPDDVTVSDGDEQDEFPEDSLPTPSAE